MGSLEPALSVAILGQFRVCNEKDSMLKSRPSWGLLLKLY